MIRGVLAIAAIALLAVGCQRAAAPKSPVATKASSNPSEPATAAPIAADSHVIPDPGKLHVFGDWITGCDNSGDCTATTVLPEGDDETDQILSMSIVRTVAGEPSVEVNQRQFDGDAGRIEVGGQRFSPDPNSQGSPEFKGQKAAAILRLPFRGQPIVVVDRHDKELGFISTKGLEQALAYMESVQRPLGGKPLSVPVIRSGYQPRARSLPVSAAKIAQLRRELQRRDHDCETDGANYSTVNPLDADHSVFFVTCWEGTANQQFAVYIARRTPAGITIEPAAFDFPAHRAGELLYINTHEGPVDTGDGEVHQEFGGGGASNPHSYGPIIDYVWDGTRFRLASLTEASSLEGRFHDEITTWWAKVVP